MAPLLRLERGIQAQPLVGVPRLADLLSDPRVERLTSLGRAQWYEQDLRTNEVRWTGSFLTHLGYDVAGVPDDPGWWLEQTHPEDRPLILQLYAEALAGQRAQWELQYRFRRANGSYAFIQGFAALVVDEDGAPSFLNGVINDVSDVYEQQERLREVERRAAVVDQLATVGRVAAGVAHDLNNLLQVLGSSIALAREPQVSPAERAEYLQEAQHAIDRVVALNRQLLAVGRRQTLTVVVDDLRSLVARFQPLLVRAAGDSVRLELVTAASPCRASVDPNQLERVVLNLVTNAREAVTENGVVKVKVEPRFLAEPLVHLHGAVPAGRWSTVSVIDHGRGIEPQTFARVFEPFFSSRPGGTGLGLPTLLGIVEQSGGHVFIETEVGAGTTVTVFFPALA